ncbi:MAG: hypothetical protein LXA50_01585 [Betaproteobacteria bacterium]|nr:hypothetical protein [Betaproteobacteria bacterium]
MAAAPLLGALFVLAPAQPAQAHPLDRAAGIIGALPLPEVFGPGACAPFVAKELLVHRQPDRIERSRQHIHPARPSAAKAGGECMPVTALVSPAGSRKGSELPTIELSYEQPAAIVLERRPRWYRIALADGSGWVNIDDTRRFIPLTRLLSSKMTYLRGGTPVPLAAQPGQAPGRDARPLDGDIAARVVSTRRLDGVLWLQVDTRGADVCEARPPVSLSGWIPMLDPARGGVPSVWFWSRGC